MERGRAESEWVRVGNAIREIPGLPFAEMIILPRGPALAFLPPDMPPREREQTFAAFLCRLWLSHYGDSQAREQLRAWLRGEPAA